MTNWVREILVTCENQSSIMYWFLLRYTVIIYKFTQGNLGAKKIASSRFQSPVKKKNRKLRHWRPTARSLIISSPLPGNLTINHWSFLQAPFNPFVSLLSSFQPIFDTKYVSFIFCITVKLMYHTKTRHCSTMLFTIWK